MKKNKKPKDNNIRSNNLLKFPKKITNKNRRKKYEPFNIVSKTGDSIYTPLITSASPSKVKQGGQVYINVDILLGELCDQIKSIQKGLALLRKTPLKQECLKRYDIILQRLRYH